MAEFSKVMKEIWRMCNSFQCCEYGCPIYDRVNTLCPVDSNAELLHDPNEIEKAVLAWAESNPEVKYPTWREWHKAEFPDAGSNVAPCHFMPRDECCKDYHCRNCDIQPIPAHIAEKLGIKPIEGGT